MRTRKQLKEDHKDAFDRGYVLVWFSFLLLEMEPKTSCMLDKGLSMSPKPELASFLLHT